MRFPLLLGLGAAVVLGGVFLMGREGTAPGAVVADSDAAPDMGYVADNAEITQTGPDGAPLYSLTAVRIEQQPETGDMHAETIAMSYRAPEENGNAAGQLWTLTAREGEVPGGGTRIQLSGDVLVRGKLRAAMQPAQIRTQRLDYDTKTQDVSTRLPVSISWGTLRLTARGLTANLKQDSLRLESAIHGRFSP